MSHILRQVDAYQALSLIASVAPDRTKTSNFTIKCGDVLTQCLTSGVPSTEQALEEHVIALRSGVTLGRQPDPPAQAWHVEGKTRASSDRGDQP